ncbi:MAG: hypothetical protein KGJ34_00615 [Patescibacteria group bacterium]|nr:hypothetical protein [Patescibacteria group bacterium]
MTDPLAKLFGSPARIKLLRLFLFNPRSSFSPEEAAARARVPDKATRREIALFSSAHLIERGRGKGVRWSINPQFEYLSGLQSLLLNAPERGRDIVERIRTSGTMKCIVLSGIFMGEWDGRLDMLLVGDRIKERKLRERMRRIEADLGKEVRYSLLSTADFLYRLNMNDRLIRDIFDYPHRIVLDRLDIGLK